MQSSSGETKGKERLGLILIGTLVTTNIQQYLLLLYYLQYLPAGAGRYTQFRAQNLRNVDETVEKSTMLSSFSLFTYYSRFCHNKYQCNNVLYCTSYSYVQYNNFKGHLRQLQLQRSFETPCSPMYCTSTVVVQNSIYNLFL